MITQRLMRLGRWTANFEGIDPATLEHFGHVIVTRQRVDSRVLDGTAMLTVSAYTGLIRSRATTGGGTVEVSGAGLEVWLGDEDDKGVVLEVPRNFSNDTFADVLDRSASEPYGLLRDDRGGQTAIRAGTIHPVPGTYTAGHDLQSQRSAIGYVLDTFRAEYRINPDGTFDAGRADDLFETSPEAIIVADAGSDPNTEGIPGQSESERDVDDYTTRVVLLARGEGDAIPTGTADIASNPYVDLWGRPVVRTRLINESETSVGNSDRRARLQLNRFINTRDDIRLVTDDYEIDGTFNVGDTVWVYDPDQGLVDLGNEVIYRGRTLNPAAIRILGMTWPITEGMGVYHRSGTGEITDLTDNVLWETSGTSLEVGATPRLVTPSTTSVVTGRINSPVRVADTLLENPGFESGSLNPHVVGADGGGTWAVVDGDASASRSGDAYLEYEFPAAGMVGDARVDLNGPPNLAAAHRVARENDVYHFEVWARHDAPNGSARVSVGMWFRSANGSVVSSSFTATISLGSSYARHSVQGIAPAGVAYVQFAVIVDSASSSTVGSVRFDDCYARQQISTEVVENLAITRAKIAGLAVGTAEIDSLSVTNAKVESLGVDKLIGGTINTTEITVASVMTMGTIGTIRTAVSGQRVEITALDADRIAFHSGGTLEPSDGPGHILAGTYLDGSTAAPQLTLRGPRANWGQTTPTGSWYSHYRQPATQAGDPALEIGYDGESTGTPHLLLGEHMVLGTGAQIFISPDTDDPAQAIMPGVLTKMDPPTWKADTTNPTPSAYDDNSVGFWVRVGNLVWFSVTFQFNAAGVGSTDDGVGAYYWDPAADGAPSIDSDVYSNSEDQSMICGAAHVKPGGRNSFRFYSAEIDNTASRIYVRGLNVRVSNTVPTSWDESDALFLSGMYAATP